MQDISRFLLLLGYKTHVKRKVAKLVPVPVAPVLLSPVTVARQVMETVIVKEKKKRVPYKLLSANIARSILL